MSVSPDYRAYVLEQLSGVPGLRAQRMFGGVGLYSGDIFFALVSDDTLYLRVDEHNRADFTARGMAAFRPYAHRPTVSLTYFAVPAEILEDATQLRIWSERALSAARAGASPRRR